MLEGDIARSIVASLVAQHNRDAAVREVRLLAASTQAKVFLIDLDTQCAPLVAKLFRKQRPAVAAALDDEFESLGLMVSAFRDIEVDGWRVTAPKPLLRCFAPPALLMTAVAGVSIDDLLQLLAPGERSELARRVCGALVAYWSSTGRIIADVRLANILVDLEKRQLAFVDPGLPDATFACSGISGNFAPSSRDLAYLLFDVLATNVRIGLLARRRAQVRAAFAADVVRCYAAEHVRSDQMPAFLAEVRACAGRHVARIPIGGPLEPWRCFVRKRTKIKLAAALDELTRR